MEANSTVVIDNGTYQIKIGFSTDYAPSILRTVIGLPPHHMLQFVGMRFKDYYTGDEAISKRGILRMRYPVENGLIHNWDQMV